MNTQTQTQTQTSEIPYTPAKFEEFLAAYRAAIEFTDINSDSPDWPAIKTAEWLAELESAIRQDCAEFWDAHGIAVNALDDDQAPPWGWPAQAGRDFWLTRNGHGAGFWDGDWPEPVASAMTKAARGFGAVWIYLGDDGKVYGGR